MKKREKEKGEKEEGKNTAIAQAKSCIAGNLKRKII